MIRTLPSPSRSSELEKIHLKLKIGKGKWSGSYGAVVTLDGRNDIVVKANFADKSSDNISMIHEMDILNKLRNNLCIVNLKVVFLGSPFIDNLEDFISPKTYRYDDIYLGLELSPFPKGFETFIRYHPRRLKEGLMQMLLGLEFLHGKGIIHQDIRPDNYLFFPDPGSPYLSPSRAKEPDDRGWVRLNDFGLARFFNYQDDYYSGLTGHEQYRAPEAVLCQRTDYKLDIWCLACTFYEMMTGNNLIRSFVLLSDMTPVFEESIKVVAKTTTKIEILEMLSRPRFETNKSVITLSNAKIDELLNLKVTPLDYVYPDIAVFNSTFGTSEQIKDLLAKMLSITPEKRPSATECLNHPFFSEMQTMITNVRKSFNYEEDRKKIKINKCDHRVNVIHAYYDLLFTEQVPWLNYHKVLFAIDLYDYYLSHTCQLIPTTDNQAMFYGLCALYISYKYLEPPFYIIQSMKELFSKTKIKEIIVAISSTFYLIELEKQFEIALFRNEKGEGVRCIYHGTLMEAIDRCEKGRRLDKLEMAKLIIYYSTLDGEIENYDVIYKNHLNEQKM